MSAKTKRRRTRASELDLELIVRRGARGRFHKLKDKTEHLPVKVVWDRREHDRRTSSEAVTEDRRNGDRRDAPPFTWAISDFVVVEKPRKRALSSSTRRRGKP